MLLGQPRTPKPLELCVMSEQSPGMAGESIRRYREEHLQISQSDLAWLAGVSRGTISNLETGRVTADDRTWHRIRNVMAWRRRALSDVRADKTVESVISSNAVQAILQAILTIRDQDGTEVGRRAADRWRRLTSSLTDVTGMPRSDLGPEFAWLARDVARKASPDRLSAILKALQTHGWAPADQDLGRADLSPGPQSDVTKIVSRLNRSVEEMSVQLRYFREEVRGYDRLPIRVQELLNHAQVVDYEVDHPADAPGVAVVDLVLVDEDAFSLLERRKTMDAARRWSSILLVTRHIFENLAADRDPRDIVQAVAETISKGPGRDVSSPTDGR